MHPAIYLCSLTHTTRVGYKYRKRGTEAGNGGAADFPLPGGAADTVFIHRHTLW